MKAGTTLISWKQHQACTDTKFNLLFNLFGICWILRGAQLKNEGGYIMDKVYMLLKIAGAFVLFYSIMVFLPMALTYISNGNVRP